MSSKVTLTCLFMTLALQACASTPAKPVSALVKQIEKDEVGVHAEMHEQYLEVAGTLQAKRVDEEERIAVRRDDVGIGVSAEGRIEKVPVVVAIVEEGGSRLKCELDEFGIDGLREIAVGSAVIAAGTLQGWERGDGTLVPVLKSCGVWPASE